MTRSRGLGVRFELPVGSTLGALNWVLEARPLNTYHLIHINMKDTIDLYRHRLHLPTHLKTLERRGVSRRNATTIRSFADQCAGEGLSEARVRKYASALTQLSKRSALPFDRWCKAEVTRVVGTIERSAYAASTKRDFRICLKKFFRWLRDTEEGYPPEVRWIRISERRQSSTLPEELLTEEEVKGLVEAAVCARDKAMLFALYESGCRIGEIATLRVRHVAFDDYDAQLSVTGKTGPRRVRLISAVPTLSAWVDAHPRGSDPGAPLWVNLGNRRHGQAMAYAAIRQMIIRTARKAGIKKRVYPHLFRHSRATHLAGHLTEAQMKEYFGWVQGSDMAATYVHLSGRDVDDALLKLHGLKKADREVSQDKLKPRACPRCHAMNSATSQYCGRCRMPLDTQAALGAEADPEHWDRLMRVFVQDPRVQALWKQKLADMMTKAGGAR